MENNKMFVYDVGRCYCHGGRWNNHPGWDLFGRCNSHGGRWNYHWSAFISILVLRCSIEPRPICVADGTCLHFYLGMDY